jgi:hypothetical protein
MTRLDRARLSLTAALDDLDGTLAGAERVREARREFEIASLLHQLVSPLRYTIPYDARRNDDSRT